MANTEIGMTDGSGSGYNHILLAHGGGGKLTFELIQGVVEKLGNPWLAPLRDSAVIKFEGTDISLAFTTDSYVVKPIFFPGGDIGRLSVSGTINDLVSVGATPKFISLSLIIEEGFPLNALERIIESIKAVANETGIAVVTGDIKVVERGKADEIFINTSGIGIFHFPFSPSVMIGDKVIVTGYIGDHGIAVLLARENLGIEVNVKSDVAPLNWVLELLEKNGLEFHCLKDPTRGGLGGALVEIAQSFGIGIVIEEAHIPVRKEVKAVCEILGLDILNVANEGKLIIITPDYVAEEVLARIKEHPAGKDAALIGEVVKEPEGKVLINTVIGSKRIVDMPYGEELPRIC